MPIGGGVLAGGVIGGLPVSAEIIVLLGTPSENHSVGVLQHSKTVVVPPVAELDTTQALQHSKTVTVTTVSELDTTQALQHSKIVTVTTVSELDTTQALQHSKTVIVAQAAELGTTGSLSGEKLFLVQATVEELDYIPALVALAYVEFLSNVEDTFYVDKKDTVFNITKRNNTFKA